jgi:hypothetical protein
MTGASVEVVDARTLDYEAFTALQLEAFAALLSERGASNAHMKPAHFRWKFAPPTAVAKIAFVREGERMVATNAKLPMDVRRGGETIRGWQSCDTATALDARGKGYFSSCLDALVSALGSDEVFFGFPNQNSMRGFEKLGWRVNGAVTTWVGPAPLPSFAGDSEVVAVDRFDDSADTFAESLYADASPVLERSAEYLNWRYVECPSHLYERLVLPGASALRGFAVIRKAQALGRDVTLVMELWGRDTRAERILMRAVRKRASGQRTHLVVLMNTTWSRTLGFTAGLFPLPLRLLPKKQLLMGMATGPRSRALLETPWRSQTGDWDAF